MWPHALQSSRLYSQLSDNDSTRLFIKLVHNVTTILHKQETYTALLYFHVTKIMLSIVFYNKTLGNAFGIISISCFSTYIQQHTMISLGWNILERKYVFRCLKAEKLLSAVEVVTGRV